MRLVDEHFAVDNSPIVEQRELFELGPEDLELFKSVDRMVVFCRGFCVFTFDPTDRFSRNYCIAQLHLAGGINLGCLSELFGLSYQYCSRILSRFKKLGVDGLREETSKRLGNRQIIDEKIGAMIILERAKGTSYEQLAEKIRFLFQKKVALQTLRNWTNKRSVAAFKEDGGAFSQLALEANQEIFENSETGRWHRNIYAGSMILYAMIERSGFLRPFAKHMREDFSKKETSASVHRVMLTLFFLHAIRCKSIEQGKHIVGKDFCQIVGGSFLRLQSLRYAIDEIVKTDGFDRALEAYFRDLIKLTEKGDRVYYTDGHFSTYYGKAVVPKGWDPRRQMGFKGRNTIYLHNSAGENIYLFESATNTSLATDIETLIGDVERLGMGLKRNTLFFDRGGYSQACFHFLKIKKKMYFATYLKNRKQERRIPEDQFKYCEIETEGGEKIEYRLFEGERRWSKCGSVRVIVLLADDGHQIPILTNNPYLKPETIAFLLSRRWREENSFKYMGRHAKGDTTGG